MGEKARTKVSKKNKYYISENRRRELKYFCLQYPEWKAMLSHIDCKRIHQDEWSDPTGEEAIKRTELANKMKLVEDCCVAADPDTWRYILLSVTEDIPYKTLYTIHEIPCSRKYFTERRLRFFYILSQEKHTF